MSFVSLFPQTIERPSLLYFERTRWDNELCLKKKVIFSVSKPLEHLVNDASDYLDKICKRLDTPLGGLGNYEDVAKYYGYDVFTVQSRFKISPDGPSKAMISSIISKHPDATVESFANVVVKQTRREDVARLLREFDCK